MAEKRQKVENTRGQKPPRKVMSNRGEVVDFELLKLKEQIKSGPKPDATVERERFIDKKRRRTAGARSKVSEMVANQAENQRYAKEMIDAQRAARKIEQANKAEGGESEVVDIVAGTSPEVESTPSPELELVERPKRIGRKVR